MGCQGFLHLYSSEYSDRKQEHQNNQIVKWVSTKCDAYLESGTFWLACRLSHIRVATLLGIYPISI